MVTTGTLFGAGDVLAQYLFPSEAPIKEKKSLFPFLSKFNNYNYPRTFRALIYGSFIFAPVSVAWHAKRLPFIKNPFISLKTRSIWSPAKLQRYDNSYRLAIDQFFGPILVWIPMYNIVMTFLELPQDPISVAKTKLENNFLDVLKANWTVWPIFQFFNIFFMPIHLRIVCSNFWSIGWNCFLSFVNNNKSHDSNHKHGLLDDLIDEKDELRIIYQ